MFMNIMLLWYIIYSYILLMHYPTQQWSDPSDLTISKERDARCVPQGSVLRLVIFSLFAPLPSTFPATTTC